MVRGRFLFFIIVSDRGECQLSETFFRNEKILFSKIHTITVILRFTAYRAPIYRVPRYNVPFRFLPDIVFYNRTCFNFPRFTVPPIYRAVLLSLEKHVKSGDIACAKFNRDSPKINFKIYLLLQFLK